MYRILQYASDLHKNGMIHRRHCVDDLYNAVMSDLQQVTNKKFLELVKHTFNIKSN
jgi:hypothetical protein